MIYLVQVDRSSYLGKKNTKIYKVEHLPSGKIYALKEIEAKNLEKLN